MPLTPEEQGELDQLEYEKLLAEKKAVVTPAAPVAPVAPRRRLGASSGFLAGQEEGVVPDTGMDAAAASLKAKGWENLSPMERVGLLALSLPKYVKEEVVGKAEGVAERAIPPALGQFLGRVTRIPGLDRLGGAIGGAGGELLAEVREGGDIKPGRVLAAAGSGAITGKPLAGAGMNEVTKEGLKYAGAGLGGELAAEIVDEGKLDPSRLAAAAGSSFVGAPAARALSSRSVVQTPDDALNALRDQTFRDVRKWGVVVPPSELGKGSDMLASAAGKAATQQQAAKMNQFAWQKAAREDIGLSPQGVPIRPSELKDLRTELGAPYREIQTIQREAKQHLDERLRALAKESDPHAAMIAMEQPAMKESLSILNTLASADVDALKSARNAAQRSRRAFFAGDPNAYEPWQTAKAQAEQLEDAIERAAASLKDETLLSRLKESRQAIAKTYSVEDALNVGNGFVDPLSFGRQLANGEPLTGNLEKIGKFQLAFRREAVEAGRVPAPGVGNLGSQLSVGMASQGDAPGMIGAVANATIGRAARPFLLSDMVQDAMLNPVERQNFAAVMARYLAENEAESLAEESSEQPAPAR